MRLRSTLTAASALALALTIAGPAWASHGRFTYSYKTADGAEVVGFVNDPPSRVCLDLPMRGSDGRSAAYAPRNMTDATATVFAQAGCEGMDFYSLPPGAGASDRLQVRSVVFS